MLKQTPILNDSTNKMSNRITNTYINNKITTRHIDRSAIIYIRQSTPQQVQRHKESREVQYNLKNRAIDFGWSEKQICIIDADLGLSGKTAEGRLGFQRLVSEVSLDHVGIILGVEMSRIARSCKDWYQLLEACAIFGTLIADLDGVYDPGLYNDRLLLGLKGTMSEAELHIIKQRMLAGKLNKARRGELNFNLPIGYLRRKNGNVTLDPDEQVRKVVYLIFQKFTELKTLNATLQYLVKNKIKIGIRAYTGINKGDIEWRRPNRMTLQNMLKNPTYAGAYVYGRRKIDPKRKIPGRPYTGRTVVKPEDCEVFIKNHFPAYISWEQYEHNIRQLQSNRSVYEEIGAARKGAALLSGLLICKKCGRRMSVQYYYERTNRYQYACSRMLSDYGEKRCQSLSGIPLDDFIAKEILKILKPTSLELNLKAAEYFEKERERLDALWQNKLERINYECKRAARQYNKVEPENRLVARQLEKEWELKLSEKQQLENEYHHFQKQQPKILTDEERNSIRRLSEDIPKLWNDSSTTIIEKKEIIREIVEIIEINVINNSEKVEIDIHWAGGHISHHKTIRPVGKIEQLTYYSELIKQIKKFAGEGLTANAIAEELNKKKFHPPKSREFFDRPSVLRLMKRLNLKNQKPYRQTDKELKENEWYLYDLAKKLNMPKITLYQWLRRGLIKSRRSKGKNWIWIVIADDKEIERLKELKRIPPGFYTRKKWIQKNSFTK